MMEDKVTYYRFYSNVRKFLEGLRKKPLNTTPSQLLENEGFTKEKLINILLKRDIIRRKESVKDQTNSDKEKPTYIVRYTIIGEDFEDKMRKIYDDYYKTNKKTTVNEDGEGGAVSASGGEGATSTMSAGDYQYDAPINGGKVMRRPIMGGMNEGTKKKRRIFITESQLCDILNSENDGDVEETTSCGSVGNFAYDSNPFKNSSFFKGAMSRPKGGIAVNKKKNKTR